MKRGSKFQNKQETKVLDSLVGSVDEVERELDETEDGADNDSEQAFDPLLPTVKKRKTFFVAGLIIALLAVVGLVSTVRFVIGVAEDISNQTALKEELEMFLYPLVLIDTPSFQTPADVPASAAINAALCKIIVGGNTSQYTVENGMMSISEIDVESTVASIFGYGLTITHQTSGLGEYTFEYNAENKSYLVPESINFTTYWPSISELSTVGDLYTVTVDYTPPIAFGIEGVDINLGNVKTMIYTVSRSGLSLSVQSVEYGGTDIPTY